MEDGNDLAETPEEKQGLAIRVEKVADEVTVDVLWDGEEAMTYKLSEKGVMDMEQHIDLITRFLKATIGRDKITKDMVRGLLADAAASHLDRN